jgi:hypothetical protein
MIDFLFSGYFYMFVETYACPILDILIIIALCKATKAVVNLLTYLKGKL